MKYLLIIGGMLLTISLSAQKSFELGLFVGGTNSIITPSFNKSIDLDIKQDFSYGIIGNYFFTNNSYLTSGVRYQSLGSSSQLPITTVEEPEGTGEYKTVHFNAHTIGIPVMWGYRLYSYKRFYISSEIGLINSFLINQELTTDVSEQEINVFNDYIVSGSVSLGLWAKLSSNFNLMLKPNFQYQLNNNMGEDFIVNDKKSKLLFYGLDIGISRMLQ